MRSQLHRATRVCAHSSLRTHRILTGLTCVFRPQGDHDGGKDEVRWKQFFMERKVGNFSDLTEAQKTRISLSAASKPMINAA